RHRGGAGGHLQRLRLLRTGLSVRGDRPAAGRWSGVEVHALLRPATRRAGARLRQGVPHRLDPVRGVGRVAGAGAATGGAPPGARGGGRPALRRRPERRGRRRRGVLPAAGRARGLWATARPGGSVTWSRANSGRSMLLMISPLMI